MLCNRTHSMPRGDFNVYFASSRRGNVRAEEYVYWYLKIIAIKLLPCPNLYCCEHCKTHVQSKVFLNLNCVVDHRAVGIALLVVILAALLILGCWYFKKRSGYKLIRVRPSHFISDLCYSDLFQKENSVHPISECIMCSVCTHLFQACITMFLFCFITNPHTPFCNLQSPRSGSSGHTGSQYSEAGSPADNKMALTDFGSFRSVVRQLLQE